MDEVLRATRANLGTGLVLLPAAALLAWALFAGGASGSGSVAPLGVAAVVVAAALLVARSLGVLSLPRLDRAVVVGAAAFVTLVAWTGLTIWWSIAGDRSWEAFAKAIVLVAFAVVGLCVVGAAERPLQALALVLTVLLTTLLAWSVLGKAVPALGPDDAGRVARLKGPVGYWNALALLADAALGCGLWLASAGPGRAYRVAGGSVVFLGSLTVLLTQSRAGLATAIVVVAGTLWLARDRIETALVVALCATPGLIVAGWAFTRPALTTDGAVRSDRVGDGAVLGVLTVGALLVVVVACLLVPFDRLVSGRREPLRRALVGSASVIVAAGAIALVVAVGNPFSWAADQLTSSGEVANSGGRLGTLETNNRTVWWGEAWDVFRANPAGGTGAGTFEIARKLYRSNAENVTEPHSLPLQLLSDTGVPGLCLAAVLVAALAIAIRSSLGRLGPPERAAAVGLLALPVSFGLHSLVDYDLDFLAVAAPATLVLAALATAGRSRAPRRGGLVFPAGAILAAAATIWVLVAPALSIRAIDASFRQSDAGDLKAAAASARRAQSLDPLSPDPLFQRATVASLAGDQSAAEVFYEDATRLQPRNPQTWYALGIFRYIAGDLCGAYQALNAAYTLDPKSSLFYPGGELDTARAAVNDARNPACGRG